MKNQAEIIDVNIFREISKSELNKTNRFLTGWLETKWQKSQIDEGKEYTRPWTEKGRFYAGFCETLYHVLNWYKLWKIVRFKHIGWNIDEKVVSNIKDKFNLLIKAALDDCEDSRYRGFLEKYEPQIISHYTAIDYKFQNITGKDISNILDFGSGIGRQAFHWCSQAGINFVSVDATESLYLLQNKVYSLLFPDKLREYFYEPQRFLQDNFFASRDTLYHLPTWRLDLLPDKYFDMITCVQVLQEISKETLHYVLSQFRRIIKKGGFLYIRDNEFWTPTHKIRVGRELFKQGWELVFRYTGEEGKDIEGVPRLWVYTGADNNKYFSHKKRIKRAFFPTYPLRANLLKDYGLPI